MALIQQLTVNQVEGEIGRGMSQMSGVIGSDAADIHGCLRSGVDLCDLLVGSVIKAQGYCCTFTVVKRVALAERTKTCICETRDLRFRP